MINVRTFQGKQVAVLGLARSGLATATALQESGAAVYAWDDSEVARTNAEAEGIVTQNPDQFDWKKIAALIVSPGVPLYFPVPNAVVKMARNANVPVMGDIELLGCSQPQAKYLGITGTNGKSTTTALVSHILKGAGRNIEVGGNLGTAALSLAPLNHDGMYVLEMSSYQLDLTSTLAWDIAVLLNLSPDHLDRHGDMDGYIKAKTRIFEQQSKTDTAIIGVDDAWCQEIYKTLKSNNHQTIIPVSVKHPVEGGGYVDQDMLIDNLYGNHTEVCSLAGIPTLPGVHNRQNACVAYAAAKVSGVNTADIVSGLNSFPGLAHRQEVVDVVDGISYINDSKATNAEAAAMALASYTSIYWIAGGLPKEGGILPLINDLKAVEHAFLIGEAAPDFAETLKGHVPYTQSNTLEQATHDAHEMVKENTDDDVVVLLSPACASFDQFNSFEARGDHFRELVKSLPGKHQLSSPYVHTQNNGEAA